MARRMRLLIWRSCRCCALVSGYLARIFWRCSTSRSDSSCSRCQMLRPKISPVTPASAVTHVRAAGDVRPYLACAAAATLSWRAEQVRRWLDVAIRAQAAGKRCEFREADHRNH